MATFPRNEPELLDLARNLIVGLQNNETSYPAPPIATEDLQTRLGAYITARNAALQAQSAVTSAIAAKNAAFQALSDGMKSDLRYAEIMVDYDDAKLKLIGWSGRNPRVALTAPGQPRTLQSPRRDDSTLVLLWKEPSEGGKVAAYKVQRRERPGGTWVDIATALTEDCALVDQPRGKELEYRIVAINKAGESAPSNAIQAMF